jgi:Putative addiction module component
MNLQYISDSEGITTGAFIPIQEWNKLKEDYHLPEDNFDLSSEQKEELDWRIDHHLKNPSELLDWEDVKKRLLANK